MIQQVFTLSQMGSEVIQNKIILLIVFIFKSSVVLFYVSVAKSCIFHESIYAEKIKKERKKQALPYCNQMKALRATLFSKSNNVCTSLTCSSHRAAVLFVQYMYI